MYPVTSLTLFFFLPKSSAPPQKKETICGQIFVEKIPLTGGNPQSPRKKKALGGRHRAENPEKVTAPFVGFWRTLWQFTSSAFFPSRTTWCFLRETIWTYPFLRRWNMRQIDKNILENIRGSIQMIQLPPPLSAELSFSGWRTWFSWRFVSEILSG